MSESEIKKQKDLLYRKVQEAYKLASEARQKWVEAQREFYEFIAKLDYDP